MPKCYTELRIFTVAVVISVALHAQQPPSVNNTLTNVLDRIPGANLRTRCAIFGELSELWRQENGFFALHPDQNDRINLGFIRLLEAEDKARQDGSIMHDGSIKSGSGDCEEYLYELTMAVSELKDDRAIPALVGAIPGSGIDLLQYGDKALGPLLRRRNSPDVLVRSVVLRVAVNILAARKDETSRVRIRDLVMSSFKDPSSSVRFATVLAIECLENKRDFVPTLEQIAKTDPSRLPGKSLDGGDNGEFYVVRAAARRVLRNIDNFEGCRPQ